jgi:sulfoxide reductase catalytic subunit YedY
MNDITPEHLYLNRRNFLKTSIYAGTGLATAGVYRFFRGSSPVGPISLEETPRILGSDSSTSLKDITHYNNFYEFSTDKEAVARKAQDWKISSWSLQVGGMVQNPTTLGLKEITSIPTEERVYRFRCVEGWSMIIPWQGFALRDLLEKAVPLKSAKYVAFESFYDEKIMPEGLSSGISLPYVEGLRLDEAMHPLTFIATGLYGKNLYNQNGAPLRLVVPWKYGFKSIKSIVKITLTDQEPPTTWNIANPSEYGFYSNVNPTVDHPRWSQAMERRIGENSLRPTLLFNGYEDQVASLYTGMDLRKNF